jgi:GTP-binding protein
MYGSQYKKNPKIIGSKMKKKFFDEITIKVKGGDGGNGCVSFEREKRKPEGPPNGGHGGNGGNVIIQTTEHNDCSLFFSKTFFQAKNGLNGKKRNCNGKSGKDVVITVPLGTIIYECEKESPYKIKKEIANLDLPNIKVIVAKGGKGGKGNSFYKSPSHRSPKIFQKGEKGENKILFLELKTIADVGLVVNYTIYILFIKNTYRDFQMQVNQVFFL